jgi:predicted ATPase
VDEVLPALGVLLRIRLAASAEAAGADVAGAYIRWLDALATAQPVILVLEDAHWADASTRELAEAVLALTDRAPVALIVTEEPVPGSEGAALRLRALAEYGHRTTEISLGPLSDEAAEQLVAAILGRKVDAASRRRLVREAEGNPLYLEELARALVDGALGPRGRTWTITLPAGERLPPALENLLVARIDCLPEPSRHLAQIAASIGRTFPVRVLEVVAGEDVREGLATLFRGEVVRELRRYPELECTFAHGLLQEAALSTLTPARKRDLHASIAAAYESLYADSLDDHLERLAHYYAQAGDLPKALVYAERARGGGGSG